MGFPTKQTHVSNQREKSASGESARPEVKAAPVSAQAPTSMALQISRVLGGPLSQHAAGRPDAVGGAGTAVSANWRQPVLELDAQRPWVVIVTDDESAAEVSTTLYGADYSAVMQTDTSPLAKAQGRFVVIPELLLPAWRARFHAAMRRVLEADIRHVEGKLLEERIDADDGAELLDYIRWWSSRRDLRAESGQSYFDVFLSRLRQDRWVRDYVVWKGGPTSFLDSLYEEVEERAGELTALIASSSLQYGAYRPAWSALDVAGRPLPGGTKVSINQELVRHSAAIILDRLEGFTSAGDSKVIGDVLTGLPAPEVAQVLNEIMSHYDDTTLGGILGRYGEAWSGGMLYSLFENLTEQDRSRVAVSLKSSGVLGAATVDALVAGRSWGARYLPWTTHKAEEAAQYWADVNVRADSWFGKAGSALAGGTAALWLPDTVGTTILTLASAGAATPETGAFAVLSKAAPTLGGVLTVLGTGATSFNMTIAVQNVATGQDVWTGRELKPEEIWSQGLIAGSSALFLAASFVPPATALTPGVSLTPPPRAPTGPRLVYSAPEPAPSAFGGGPRTAVFRETRVIYQRGPGGTAALRVVTVEVPVAPQPAAPPLRLVPPVPATAPLPTTAMAGVPPAPTAAGPAVAGAVTTSAAPQAAPKPAPADDSETQPNAPSGLQENNPGDYIPIVWFKPLIAYPEVLHLVDPWGDFRDYHMTTSGQPLERGYSIGVAPKFRPWLFKPLQMQYLLDEDRGPRVATFRRLLVRHGWTEGETHEIDHVQELFWSGDDAFNNLWPLESGLNGRAGNNFKNFRVTYSNKPGGGPATPATTDVRLTDGMRAPGANNLVRRWFIIKSFDL